MNLTIAVPEMAVVLATRVAAETCPTGGTVHNVVNDELGIWHQNHAVASLAVLTHGTKFAEFCLSAKVPLRIVPTDLVLELVYRVLNCKISFLPLASKGFALTVPHAQLAAVRDGHSQVLAQRGVDSRQQALLLEDRGGEVVYVGTLRVS
jgi:hypothetical protein